MVYRNMFFSLLILGLMLCGIVRLIMKIGWW